MDLNFKWTCPEIDEKIKEINIEFDDAKEKVAEILNSVYEIVKDKIEELRELNSKMRDAADSQIDILYKENQELTRHIKELEEKIEKYE